MAGLFKPRIEGVGEERQDGFPRADKDQFLCDSFEDWLVVSEKRPEAQEDTKIQRDLGRHTMPWYHGRMNRSVAEDHLSKSVRFDGTFMVRESDAISVRKDPVYIISVMNNGETHHVEVEKRADGKYSLAYIEGAKKFKSLKKLVEYYRSKPLDLEGGGKCKLKYAMEDR